MTLVKQGDLPCPLGRAKFWSLDQLSNLAQSRSAVELWFPLAVQTQQISTDGQIETLWNLQRRIWAHCSLESDSCGLWKCPNGWNGLKWVKDGESVIALLKNCNWTYAMICKDHQGSMYDNVKPSQKERNVEIMIMISEVLHTHTVTLTAWFAYTRWILPHGVNLKVIKTLQVNT